MNSNQNPENGNSTQQPSLLENIRNEVATAIEYGRVMTGLASLIAVAGILYWCPRCGQWMGAGSEGVGPGAPKPEMPPPPRRLLKALGVLLQGEPTPVRDLPKRDGNKLTPRSGVLENEQARFGDKPAKHRYNPPSDAHGRKVDTYYDGSPNPDSRPHAHLAEFIRGDEDQTLLYDRNRDGTVVYDNGVDVVMGQDGVYQWMPRANAEER